MKKRILIPMVVLFGLAFSFHKPINKDNSNMFIESDNIAYAENGSVCVHAIGWICQYGGVIMANHRLEY